MVEELHRVGAVFKDGNAWVIDFEGGYTRGWVGTRGREPLSSELLDCSTLEVHCYRIGLLKAVCTAGYL
jgi:hypothetical protein